MKLFPPDFKDFLLILNKLRVRYLVVGGWALGFHGWPRLTRDIDIWIAVDAENAEKVRQALREFHAPGPIPDDFFSDKEKNIYFMGIPPTRIEVISSIDGVKFEECFSNRQMVLHDGVEVPIIGLDDLKSNKAASGRLKDLADLEDLGE
jgi:hypothetical protein